MIAPGRVVDDELDAGRGLERADVAALAADDAALEVVARQIDHRHRRFDGVLGGAALDGVGDDLLRADGGGLARLGFEALDEVGGVAAGVGFDLLQEELAGLVGGEAGHALQLALPLGDQLVGAGPARPRRPLRAGRGSVTFARSSCSTRSQVVSRSVERAGLVGERLLEAQDLVAPLADVLSDSAAAAWAFSRASSAASLRRLSASRSA